LNESDFTNRSVECLTETPDNMLIDYRATDLRTLDDINPTVITAYFNRLGKG